MKSKPSLGPRAQSQRKMIFQRNTPNETINRRKCDLVLYSSSILEWSFVILCLISSTSQRLYKLKAQIKRLQQYYLHAFLGERRVKLCMMLILGVHIKLGLNGKEEVWCQGWHYPDALQKILDWHDFSIFVLLIVHSLHLCRSQNGKPNWIPSRHARHVLAWLQEVWGGAPLHLSQDVQDWRHCWRQG